MEIFIETLLPKKEDSYSHLNMEDITDADFTRAIYTVACFFTVPGLVWQAGLKKTKVRLDLLTDIDMFLVVEYGIKNGICQPWCLSIY